MQRLKNLFSKELLLLLTLALVQFTNVLDFMIMMPLGPQLMRLFDINPQQFSIAVSAYTFSAGLFGFIAAFFIDRFDRKSILLFLYIGFAIGTLLCGLSDSYYMIIGARIFTGMFGGAMGGIVLSIVGDSIPLERRASAMGLVMAAFSIASVVGVPVGLALANAISWKAPFILLASMSILVVLCIYLFIPTMTSHLVDKKISADPFKFLINIFKDTNQVKALLLMVFIILSQFSYISMISPYLVSNVGFSENQLGYVYLVGGILSMAAAPISGKLADKYGRSLVFTIGTIGAMIPTLILTNLGITPLWIVLIITGFNFIFITARMIPAQTMVTATVLPHQRGGFMSINACVTQLASGLGVYMAGLIIYKSTQGLIINYNIVGYIALACSIITIVLGNSLKTVTETKK